MNRTAKVTIAMLSTLLVVAAVWIANKEMQEARWREWQREISVETMRTQAELNRKWDETHANSTAEPACAPCPPCAAHPGSP